jgi:hypothetical protein
MSYENLKKKYPDLNWQEAEEVSIEDLQAAADFDINQIINQNGKDSK